MESTSEHKMSAVTISRRFRAWERESSRRDREFRVCRAVKRGVAEPPVKRAVVELPVSSREVERGRRERSSSVEERGREPKNGFCKRHAPLSSIFINSMSPLFDLSALSLCSHSVRASLCFIALERTCNGIRFAHNSQHAVHPISNLTDLKRRSGARPALDIYIRQYQPLHDVVEGTDVEVPEFNVSYKPQKITPKFPSTVRHLLHQKIRDSYMHPQFMSDVMKPLQIEQLMDQEVVNLSGGELQRVALCLCLRKCVMTEDSRSYPPKAIPAKGHTRPRPYPIFLYRAGLLCDKRGSSVMSWAPP
ncbi:hypothetical protein Syun_023631 [Stephania yunnanensis]|uniref:ABC transporter domain-containing protein n=1 Tax=Stephania yunnanensis TaxID=152371 RepID=A0AAP0F9A5_9MAGN